MFSRVNYTIVGLFVVILGIALLAAGLWFSADLGREDGKQYLLFPQEPLTGLSRNSAVKYQGLDVGRVREMGLDDQGRVRVVLTVQDNVPIYANTRVRLASQGLTGLGHLELVPGSADAGPPSSEDYEHPVLRPAPSLRTRLERAAEDGMASIDRMADRMERLLSEDNVRTIAATVSHLERLSGTLADDADDLGRTLEETERLIRDIRDVVQGTPETFARMEQSMDRFDATLANFDTAAASVETLADSLRNTGERGGDTLDRINRETLPELNRLLLDVRGLTHTLDRFGQDLSDHPNQLLFGPPRRVPGPGERD